jgi:hypothetical protein
MIGFNEAEQSREAALADERRPLPEHGGWKATGTASKGRDGEVWIEEVWTGPDMDTPPYYETGETQWRNIGK